MPLNNLKLSNLNAIPKTIILLIDNKEKVIESSGKQLEQFNILINNKSLASLFQKKIIIY